MSWFLLACTLALGPFTLFRTLRFHSLLGRPVPGLAWVLLRTRALNSFLPARLGETYRYVACRQRGGCSAGELALAIGVESLIDVVVFAAIATTAAHRIWPRVPIYAGPVVLLGLLLIWRRLILAASLTLLSDLTDAAMVGCCLKLYGIASDPALCCLVLVTMNLASLIPVPGNLGTLEAGAISGLAVAHVDSRIALLFALAYRASHVIPVLAATGFHGIASAFRNRCKTA